MKKLTEKLAFVFLAGIALSLSACNKNDSIESMHEKVLFEMEYGNFTEQVSPDDLNRIGDVRYGIAMQDGFFYLVDGCSNKLMEMNSYGDLLTLFYNEDSELATLLSKTERSTGYSAWEINYPFNFNGQIVVDSEKTIFAVCNLPSERYEKNENGQLCTQVVMRMARDGSSIDYIGQQGNGGSPYPSIKNIYITNNDELVVVCNTIEGMIVYWYAKEGFLKNTIPVSNKNVPIIRAETPGAEVYMTLDNIIPDPSVDKVYLKVDYYNASYDDDSSVQTGINYTQSLIYPLDCETSLYEDSVSIPPYEESIVSDYSKITYKIPYDFLGMTPNGWKYFIIKTADGFSLELIQSESQKLIRRNFKINHNENMYFNMYLSRDGIITVFYMDKNKPKVAWYRTDSIIDNLIQ